jgi:membrane-associated phospholipid phosphatase
MDLLEGLDWGTYYFFRFQANKAPGWKNAMEFGDHIGSYLAVAGVIALIVALSLYAGQWRMAMAAIIGLLVSAALVEGLRLATQRPRPPDAQNLLASAELTHGFPSRAVFLTAFAWLMLAAALERCPLHKAYRSAAYLIASLVIVVVSVSQLWLGLHFVTDILAGLSGGIGLALVARWAAIGHA